MDKKVDFKETREYNNFIMLKALDEVDRDKAIEVISHPNLDGKELSEILNCHFMKMIVLKKNNEPMQLSNEVVAAGVRNKFFQMVRDAESKEPEF